MNTTLTPLLRNIAVTAVSLVALGGAGTFASPALASASDGATVAQGARGQHLAPSRGRAAAPAGSTVHAATKAWPRLNAGSRGTDVRSAQHLLAAAGHKVAADGVFGPGTASAVKAFQKSHRLKADGIVGANTWNVLVTGTSNAPAPGSGRLTNRQALARLAAAGIERPAGRTSLEGVRARTIAGVIALKKASGCPITITGGTESGHGAGSRSHAKGYKLDLRTRDEGGCVTGWIKKTQRKGKPRGNDPRWHGNLNGISLEYVYETPRRGGVHWDITFV
ncbi:peptidoglycan-binding protein [Streptomyces sp. LN549]|uniref:peptidoglycan-binding domain-containing protein n=1 Tax=Streptomyces sp. LN549 TaxID=3112979 RepID=UPI003716C222